MRSFTNLLKYWRASEVLFPGDPDLQIMDVTALRCEEDRDSLQLLDDSGRVIAEFGPGKAYTGWLLTVEYAPLRERHYGEACFPFAGQPASIEW
jgi:hypothetical protein